MASIPEDANAAVGWEAPVPITRFRQMGVNLRIWLPLLSNRSWELRELKYTARENRRGDRWEVSFPEECWRCRAKSALEFVKLSRTVRGFENPMGPVVLCPLIVLLAIASAIALEMPVLLWSSPAVLTLGAFWLWLKSSSERVELSLAACATHRLGVQEPDVAVFDNELYVFAHSPELALAAKQDQTASRRSGRASGDGALPPDDRPSNGTGKNGTDRKDKKRKRTTESADDPAPAVSPRVPKREELPPIKLDD